MGILGKGENFNWEKLDNVEVLKKEFESLKF